ncbi:MAG: DNA repair exonuclease [Candidatus Micrarchaeia archaeon]
MKIAVMSDFHLGYENSLFRELYEDSFVHAERALTKACELSDAIIIAGDIFDSRVPKPEVIARAFKIFSAVREKPTKIRISGIPNSRSNFPLIAIHGTHERRTTGFINPVQLLEIAGFIVDIHKKQVVLEEGDERVAIYGIGGVPDEYASHALEKLKPQPVENAFNILVMHQTLSEFIPSKTAMSVDSLPAGFDLYVFGHLHKAGVHFLGNKKILVPGSTIVTQFRKEEMREKGFFVIDTKTGKKEFIQIMTRPFIYEEIKLENATPESIKYACDELLRRMPRSGMKPIVRIHLKGTFAEGYSSSEIPDCSEWHELAFVVIDADMEIHDISKKIEKIREMRNNRLSARERGIEILKKYVENSGFSLLRENFEELIESIIADPEKALGGMVDEE